MGDRTGSVKVFISHSKDETSLALTIREALVRHGFRAWSYEEDLPFGGTLAEEIQSNISECDHFLVILSASAQKSPWVARELGLALKLRKKRGPRPSILGIYSKPADTRRGRKTKTLCSIRSRRFSDGVPHKSRYDFKNVRYFNFSTDQVSSLVEQLRLKVSFINSTDGEDIDLLTKSFECYRALFPIQKERDAPNDILCWLDEAQAAAGLGLPWKEIYAVMHTGGLPIGMAYLSVHMERHWCFGNYFGVRAGWRQDSRAKFFLEALKRKLYEVDPGSKGILFEVEPIDYKGLRRAVTARPLRSLQADVRLRTNLRRLRRLFLYTNHHAEAFVDLKGVPLPYWQPAMTAPPERKKEVPFILMALLRKRDFPLHELLSFIYDDLYGDAYSGEVSSVEIPGYRKYVEKLKARVAARAARGWQFAKLKLPRSSGELLLRAKKEHLDRWISL